jgi:hypothetical protein
MKENVLTGFKEDPPYRNNPPYRNYLPPSEMPPPQIPAGPRSGPEIPISRGDRTRVEPLTVGTLDDLPPQD